MPSGVKLTSFLRYHRFTQESVGLTRLGGLENSVRRGEWSEAEPWAIPINAHRSERADWSWPISLGFHDFSSSVGKAPKGPKELSPG
jgi:hypothetical protein